jgi:hypothetical protein
VTCSEERVVALLAGELGDEERVELDEHLLTCSACWRAVQEDRAGRLALEQLREPAPAGLADRVRFAVELAPSEPDAVPAAEHQPTRPSISPPTDPAPSRGRHPRRAHRRLALLAAAACLLAAALAGSLAAVLGPSVAPDPPAVRAVAAMALARSGPPVRLAATHTTERMVVAGQPLLIGAYRVEGVLTVVAVSPRPFAMPASSRVVHGSSSGAWMATRGPVGLWCINDPHGKHSMLVAAEMPAVQLPAVISRLHVTSL